ncbi:MAG TPA: Uma2 family endonuclease [Dehalococcoidia bacterium]|nr:Uma2 family endonuclease [Dehalococcoidia bacterium]
MSRTLPQPADWLPDDHPLRRLPPTPISYEDFLAWCDEDTYAEWVDGEIVFMSPVSSDHQRIVQFLVWLFQAVIELTEAGVVRSGPFQMKLPEHVRSGREPDILFIARDHLDRLLPTYLDGPADLVVEVMSPESFSRDRGDKFLEYEAGGVPEYWLIDPIRRWVDVYRLSAEGRYVPAFSGRDGVLASDLLPGLRLHLEWLWQDPPPKQVEVRRILGLP